MRGTLFRHLKKLFLLLASAAGAGWIGGHPMLGLLAGMTLYLGQTLFQLARLYRWLTTAAKGTEPPESSGIWGELLDTIYQLQKNHTRSRDRLQTMINRVRESTNSLRDGVVMTDASGSMEWWNHAAEYLCGFRSSADRGEYIYNLIRAPEFRHYFEAKDYSDPLEIPSPARPQLSLEIQINLFGKDDRLITIKDVTRIHQLEKMRRDFVSNVSHEMRTPLTVITGYLETITEQTEQVPKGWRRPLETMRHQANRMEALITDLLLLSRVETSDRGTTNAVCRLRPLLEQIQKDAIALSGEQRHQITLTMCDDHAIRGDETQLRSAFSNLVFNAVKYTPGGGEIRMQYRLGGETAQLSVSDNGPGIDPEHQPRLTERFYRADPSRSKETGGTGLGLAIVKHVLYNHDGSLTIDSTLGTGSTFTCHFPLERLVRENGQ